MGGQLMLTTTVENFPGFPDGIMGPELMESMRKQAARFGTDFFVGDVTAVDITTRPFRIWVGDQEFRTKTLVIASGASAKLLELESERMLMGRGVSTCATCDGYFFRGKEVVVVGGGDSAIEESIFLTKFANEVTLIHRRDKLRASKILQERAFQNKKIKFLWNHVVENISDTKLGEVTGVAVRDVQSSETHFKPCSGVFIAIGHNPNTELFRGQLQLDQRGYIVTRNGTTQTNVPGVFACGDVQDPSYRQAVTAAGSGCMAAIDAERFLESTE